MTFTDNSLYTNRYLLVLILFCASVVLYGRSVNNQLVWDAKMVIAEDPDIRDFRRLPEYFKHHATFSVPTEGKEEKILYYRPVLKTIHMLEFSLFKLNPVGYNIMNILLNALVVVAMFAVVNAITGNILVAFVSSALFMVNPSHVEAVSWVYSDSYIIAALLCLGSLYSFHLKRHIVAAVFLLFALLTHEQSIQMIFALALYELVIRRESLKAALTRLSPSLAMVVAYMVLRSFAIPGNVYQGQKIANALPSSIVVLMKYLKIFFVPDALVTLYPLGTFRYSTAELIASLVACGVVIGGILFLVKKRWLEELFWTGWFFIWLMVPIAAIVMGRLGDFLMADKLLYIPSIGLSVAIAMLLVKIFNGRTMAVSLLAGAICLYHGAYTVARTGYWKSNLVYFEKAYEFSPDFPLLTYSLGLEYAQNGALEKAGQLFRRTIALNPFHSMAYCNLGNVFYMKGDIPASIAAWENAIRSDRTNPIPYYNLGMVKEKEGDRAAALQMYRRYLELNPNAPDSIRLQIRMLETSPR